MTIWERYETDQRGQVWVAEGIRPDLDPASGADQLEIIDACLDAIEASHEFLLLDTGEYGSYLHFRGTPSESSFLELELFQATLLRKPIKYIYVGSTAEQSNLHALVRSLAPQVSAVKVDSLKEAEKTISTYLDGGARLPETKNPERLTGTLIQGRHQDWSNASLFHEPQFLHGTICGPTNAQTDLDVAAHYLDLAAEHSETNRILSRTWIAIRTLMAAHYSDTRDPRPLALWDRALRSWSKAAAWRGLHGHIWLGNVSALGSLARIKGTLETPLYDPASPGQGDLYDGLASVYYSLSKRCPRRIGPAMLARSAAYTEEGLETRPQEDRGSLLPIRGSINHRRRRFRASARDFGEAYDLAVKNSESSGQIGFLLTELGFAELFLLKPRLARQRIAEGLTMMTPENSSPGFRVRALRKHVVASLACFDLAQARLSATKAYQIASENQLHDQIDRIVLKLKREDSA
ncbi:hypothetical protein [Sulfitobacter sp. S190]|uniref:hypothetical protein n=1 Tax=Sulfitobacter sp. S190 TaxID=2867022 RepID=UPI0021A5FCD3|nr:hypothetical protein [Sulfitobacter sp. S190]UWR24621.1 hypothetical protein K3756_19065 [Sulfitobacter sp. S190]